MRNAEAQLLVDDNAGTIEKLGRICGYEPRTIQSISIKTIALVSRSSETASTCPIDRSRQATSGSLAFCSFHRGETRVRICVHSYSTFAVRLGGSDPESHRPMRGEAGRPKAVQMGVAPAQTLNPVVRPRWSPGS